MTCNQQRAVILARRLCVGMTESESICDSDWHLLLLAAGMNNARSLPLLVARRVLDRATRRAGYFADHSDLGGAVVEGPDEVQGRWA